VATALSVTFSSFAAYNFEEFDFDMACGVNASYIALALKDRTVSYATLLQELNPSKDMGVSMLQIKKILEKHGIVCSAELRTEQEVRDCPNPQIMMTTSFDQSKRGEVYHYIVCVGLGSRGIQIIDAPFPPKIIEADRTHEKYAILTLN